MAKQTVLTCVGQSTQKVKTIACFGTCVAPQISSYRLVPRVSCILSLLPFTHLLMRSLGVCPQNWCLGLLQNNSPSSRAATQQFKLSKACTKTKAPSRSNKHNANKAPKAKKEPRNLHKAEIKQRSTKQHIFSQTREAHAAPDFATVRLQGLPNAVVAALEPELVSPAAWGAGARSRVERVVCNGGGGFRAGRRGEG